MNENYTHPTIPKGCENGILKGMYLAKESKTNENKLKPQLMGSGAILREVLRARKMLEEDFGIASDVWSVTSFNSLSRDALEKDRWNQLNPEKRKKISYLQSILKGKKGPFVAATDYMRIVPDQLERWIPGIYRTLGTDGYGRSDSRDALREHFEVNSKFIVITTLRALLDAGEIESKTITKAIKKYKIDVNKPNPEKS